MNLNLVYRDKSGKETTRSVKYLRRDQTHLYTICSLRQEPRTFRLDGIIRMYDEDTGELFVLKEEYAKELTAPQNLRSLCQR